MGILFAKDFLPGPPVHEQRGVPTMGYYLGNFLKSLCGHRLRAVESRTGDLFLVYSLLFIHFCLFLYMCICWLILRVIVCGDILVGIFVLECVCGCTCVDTLLWLQLCILTLWCFRGYVWVRIFFSGLFLSTFILLYKSSSLIPLSARAHLELHSPWSGNSLVPFGIWS